MDTSSFLKFFYKEKESFAVLDVINSLDNIVISSLTKLETIIQFQAGLLGGDFNRAQYESYLELLDQLSLKQPFTFSLVFGSVFNTAIEQVTAVRGLNSYLRVQDRLHIACMAELGISHLITNDLRQAEAARSFSYEVIIPA